MYTKFEPEIGDWKTNSNVTIYFVFDPLEVFKCQENLRTMLNKNTKGVFEKVGKNFSVKKFAATLGYTATFAAKDGQPPKGRAVVMEICDTSIAGLQTRFMQRFFHSMAVAYKEETGKDHFVEKHHFDYFLAQKLSVTGLVIEIFDAEKVRVDVDKILRCLENTIFMTAEHEELLKHLHEKADEVTPVNENFEPINST